jgi:hypothetical protein
MVRLTMVTLLIMQGLAASLALAQGGALKLGELPPPRTGYKVAFWYDRRRPAETFRYQVYDLRKAPYDQAAVGRWLDLVRSRFPDYAAYVRDVPTAREPGKDEQEALMAAIEQEKQRIARINRTDSGIPPAAGDQSPRSATPTPSQESPRPNVTNYVPIPNYGQLMHPSISGYGPAGPARQSSIGGSLGGSMRFGSSPLSPSYPFPYPYPRPHP